MVPAPTWRNKVTGYWRISAKSSLPKEKRKQAQGLNSYVGVKFRCQTDAIAARDALPEKHLFEVCHCIPAMNPFT